MGSTLSNSTLLIILEENNIKKEFRFLFEVKIAGFQ